MTIFNGYEPNESRTRKLRPRKADKGHSPVRITTTRNGSRFSFRYEQECQCGKVFRSRQSQMSLVYRHDAHIREETQ